MLLCSATPGAIFEALDRARPTSKTEISTVDTDVCGLQYLEELVVECEVGADVLLALRGKTPRLRALVISQLASGEASAPHVAEPTTAAEVPVEEDGREEGGQPTQGTVTPFEALLLLLQSLPPQQLRVFGLNSALPRFEQPRTATIQGRFGASGKQTQAEAAALHIAVEDLRKRVDQRRRTGFPEEAESDELLTLLTEQQNETLCALWVSLLATALNTLTWLSLSSICEQTLGLLPVFL